MQPQTSVVDVRVDPNVPTLAPSANGDEPSRVRPIEEELPAAVLLDGRIARGPKQCDDEHHADGDDDSGDRGRSRAPEQPRDRRPECSGPRARQPSATIATATLLGCAVRCYSAVARRWAGATTYVVGTGRVFINRPCLEPVGDATLALSRLSVIDTSSRLAVGRQRIAIWRQATCMPQDRLSHRDSASGVLPDRRARIARGVVRNHRWQLLRQRRLLAVVEQGGDLREGNVGSGQPLLGSCSAGSILDLLERRALVTEAPLQRSRVHGEGAGHVGAAAGSGAQ